MTNTPNRYTLILLKDYANLSQIKVSPFTFWLLVTLFISAFLFCFIAIIISGFIWQNSNAIRLEKDALYKQLVAAQVRINRLTAVEDIVYKKNIAVAKINKRADVENQHVVLASTQEKNRKASPVKENIAMNAATPQRRPEESIDIPPTIPAVENKELALVEPPIQNTTQTKQDIPVVATIAQGKREEKQPIIKEKAKSTPASLSTSRKELKSKVVALRNIKTSLGAHAIFIDMDIVNTSQSKQDGTIQYTIVTKNAEYKVNPSDSRKNSFYAISKMKDVKTRLALPKGVNQQMVVGIKIELLNENTPIVRIFEEL